MLTPNAIREIATLQAEANALLAQRSITRAQGKRADLLLSKIKTIRDQGLSSDEVLHFVVNEKRAHAGLPPIEVSTASPEEMRHQHLFGRYLRGEELSPEERATTFVAGTQTLAFTNGPAGGMLVPMSFAQDVAEARALVDPLLNENIVSLVDEGAFKLPPLQIPGWDLTSASAQIVSEASQQNPQVIPNLDQTLTNKFTYRVNLVGSFEFEDDSKGYGSAMSALARAIGIAEARAIGADLINGNGSAAPQGIVTGSTNSGLTTFAAGSFTWTDFTSLYFNLNAEYRNAPKAAWLVGTPQMKWIREMKDSQNRPLIPVVDDTPQILGAPVYECPSLTGKILFGDLSHYYVHCSTLFVRRRTQLPNLVEFGKAAWIALRMVDAIVNDPSSGASAPIQYETLHA